GDIPVDAATVFVDGSYAGMSDGTAAHPWPTITQGIAHASAGSTIAVAAGTYLESLTLLSDHVRLWGRCPALVSIVSPVATTPAIVVLGADGAEIRDLAVTGPSIGIGVKNSVDVQIDRVWLHDLSERGILLQHTVGPNSAKLTRSLIER